MCLSLECTTNFCAQFETIGKTLKYEVHSLSNFIWRVEYFKQIIHILLIEKESLPFPEYRIVSLLTENLKMQQNKLTFFCFELHS